MFCHAEHIHHTPAHGNATYPLHTSSYITQAIRCDAPEPLGNACTALQQGTHASVAFHNSAHHCMH